MNGSDAKLPTHYPKSCEGREIRMETRETGLIGFDPVKFIELLLKLDSRAKGYEVKVEVTKRKKKEAQTA